MHRDPRNFLPHNPLGRFWPTQRVLAIGYAVVVALLALNVLLTLGNLGGIAKDWSAISQTHDVITSLNGLLSNLRDAETGQRGFLLTGEESYLTPYLEARASLDRSVARVLELTENNGVEREHALGIDETVAAKLAELEQTIALRREKGMDAALSVVRTGQGKALMDRLREQVAEMDADEARHRDGLKFAFERRLRDTLLSFLLVSSLSLALLVLVHAFDRRGREASRINARWLTTTLRSIGDAVIATDAEGRVNFMNPVAEVLTGWSVSEARGRPLDEVFLITNEETGAAVESPVAKVLREGVIVGLANHTVLTSRDGTGRPIEDSAAPIMDESILGVVLVFRDASEVREAEARVRASEERYRSLVAATTQAVWVATPDFGAIRPLTGQASIEPASNTMQPGGWLDAVHPDDRSKTRQAFEQAARARSVFEVEHRVRTRADGYRHHLARAVPLLDPAGEIREWIGTSSDITERREAEEARERLYQELRDNDKRKDEFLAMLAHELRNPLAAIGSAVSLTSASGLQEHLTWSMGVINRQIKHLTRLIEDLLDVSRISRGKIELRRDIVDLTPLLEGVVQAIGPLLEDRNHTLSVALDRGNLWVDGDATRLEQVAANLLTNAAKYTNNGGHIWLSARHEGDEVVLAVRDDGVGIPPEKLPEM